MSTDRAITVHEERRPDGTLARYQVDGFGRTASIQPDEWGADLIRDAQKNVIRFVLTGALSGTISTAKYCPCKEPEPYTRPSDVLICLLCGMPIAPKPEAPRPRP